MSSGSNYIRRSARKLYGRGISNNAAMRHLSDDLETPLGTVRNWWQGRHRLPGGVRVALRLLTLIRGASPSPK